SGGGISLLFLDDAGAADRAQENAVTALQSTLEYAVEPSRCPKCEWYQTEMVEVLRGRRGEASAKTAFVLVAAAAIACIPAGTFDDPHTKGVAASALAVAALAACGAVAAMCRWVWVKTKWSPNDDEPWRRASWRGESSGWEISRQEFEQLESAWSPP